MRLIAAAFLTACLVFPVMAQQPAPPPDQPPPPNAAPPPDQPPPTAQPDQLPPPGAMAPGRGNADGVRGKSARRAMCRDRLRAQGANGMSRRDALQLCMEEGRMSCFKQAIAQKLNGPARTDFLKTCAG